MKELIQIFYEPGKVFDYVREKGAWLAPLAAGTLLFICMMVYIYQSIGAGNITRQTLNESKLAAQMTPEMKETAIAKADTTAGKVQNIGFATVGYLVVMVVFGLMFMGIAAASGGKLRFAQAMGTVGYAAWPFTVLRFILSAVVIMMAADKAELNPQRLLAFNAGAFLDRATTAKPLFALASAFDLLTFAQIALAGLGLSRVAGISFTKALVGLGLIWLLFTLLAMGLALVF